MCGLWYYMKSKKLPYGSYSVQVVAGFDEKGKRIVKSFTADTEWDAIRMAEQFKLTHEERTDKNAHNKRQDIRRCARRGMTAMQKMIETYEESRKAVFKRIHEINRLYTRFVSPILNQALVMPILRMVMPFMLLVIKESE